MKGKEYSDLFLEFWAKYPERWIPESDKHVKIGKHKAWKQWCGINNQTQKLIMIILPIYKKEISSSIIPDAWRWLRDRKWDDYETKQPQGPKAKPQQKPKVTLATAKEKAEIKQMSKVLADKWTAPKKETKKQKELAKQKQLDALLKTEIL